MEAARILAQIMEGYKEIPVEQRRDHLNLMMKQVIIRNSELGSVYANWVSNALDGMDAQYSNTPGTDESGRFISAWRRNNDKTITLSAIERSGR
jgi:methyl-accepting chemotaxis protein